MTLRIDRNADALALIAERGGERTRAFAVRRPSRYEPHAEAVLVAAEQVRGETAALGDELLPAAIVRRIRAAHAEHTGPAARALQDAIRADRRDHAARLASLMSSPADPAIAAEDRAAARSVPAPQRRRWIGLADRNALAAVVTVGRQRWADWTVAEWTAATERLAMLTHVERTGLAARFAVKPTAENPAPIGVDWRAAEAFAAEAMERFHAEQADTDRAEKALADLLGVVALSGDLATADEAFDLLGMGGEAD